MRVTVQHTLDITEMPRYISDKLETTLNELKLVLDMAQGAKEESELGRFIDSSELIDTLRQKMALLDTNLGEIQSLQLSYEKTRIAQSMPDMTGEPREDLNE